MKLLTKLSLWAKSLVRGPAAQPQRSAKATSPTEAKAGPANEGLPETRHDLEEGRVADLLERRRSQSQSKEGDHS